MIYGTTWQQYKSKLCAREKLQPKFSVTEKQLRVMPYIYITDEEMGWDGIVHCTS